MGSKVDASLTPPSVVTIWWPQGSDLAPQSSASSQLMEMAPSTPWAGGRKQVDILWHLGQGWLQGVLPGEPGTGPRVWGEGVPLAPQARLQTCLDPWQGMEAEGSLRSPEAPGL